MPAKHLMIAIHWFGPYATLDEARAAARGDYRDGLYICIGRRLRQRTTRVQYVGLSKTLHTRLNERHHALQHVARARQIWLGEIVTAEPSGRRLKVTRATLDYAEWLHARFLSLPLNAAKTKGLPPRSVTVLNRWFGRDYETPRGRRPHKDWPDLIDFPDLEGVPARAVWFGSRQRYFAAPEYAPVEAEPFIPVVLS